MKATTGTRRSLRAPLLIAAFAGLAATASGCIIDSDPPCDPRIFIPWALEIAGTNPPVPITCFEAGVSFIGADVNAYPYEVNCPANFSAGTMTIPVGGAGSYTIVVAALDAAGNPVVAPTPSMTVNLPTACGTLQTDEAVFLIP